MAEATGDSIGSKIADKVTEILRSSSENNWEALGMSTIKIYLKNDINLQKKRHIIIDVWRLI